MADDARPWERPGTVRRDCQPHRGHVLVWLGAASVVCAAFATCMWAPAFLGFGIGLATVMMADGDLRKMAAGDMDPAGQAPTAQGREWGSAGMLVCIFWVFACPLLAGFLVRV